MFGKSWIYTQQKEGKCHVWSCIWTEKLVRFSEIQIKLKNKSNFLKLEENSTDYTLNQEVILLEENQKTEPVQEEKKLLHVSLWLHSPAGQVGAETSGGHRPLPDWEWWQHPEQGYQMIFFSFCKVRVGMSHQWFLRLHFSGLQRLIPCLKTGRQTITRPSSTFTHHLSNARQLCERDQPGSGFVALHDYILTKDILAEKLWGISKTFIMTYYHGCFLLDISSLTGLLIFIAAITKMSAICLQSLSPG